SAKWRLSAQYFSERLMSADFVAPALGDARRRTTNTYRTDQLIVNDDRKGSRIREQTEQNLLQFTIWILADAICQTFAWFAVCERCSSFHLGGHDTKIVLAVHAVHVDVVTVVIENVDGDADTFFLRQTLARLDNPFRGCQIDRGEIVNFLCSVA